MSSIVLEDFIGSSIPAGKTSTPAVLHNPQITDGINVLENAESTYELKAEKIEGFLPLQNGFEMYSGGSTPIGDAFKFRYMSSDVLTTSAEPISLAYADYLGIQCSKLVVGADLVLEPVDTSSTPVSPLGFSGRGSKNGLNGSSGNNMMDGFWDFMPSGGRGGDGYSNATDGGVGFSGGGSSYTDGTHRQGGHGGGLILIVADEVYGSGTIKAKGGDAINGGGGGGGGMVIVITAKWNGEVGIDVSGGLPASNGHIGDVGAFVILKKNIDNTLTLMVHSRGTSLNGQTPVHGADASIAW